jgi:hypothetical protein
MHNKLQCSLLALFIVLHGIITRPGDAHAIPNVPRLSCPWLCTQLDIQDISGTGNECSTAQANRRRGEIAFWRTCFGLVAQNITPGLDPAEYMDVEYGQPVNTGMCTSTTTLLCCSCEVIVMLPTPSPGNNG